MNTSYVTSLCEALVLVKQEVLGLNELMAVLEKLYPTSFEAGDKEDLVIIPYDDHQQVESALGRFRDGSWIEYCAYIHGGKPTGRRITWYAMNEDHDERDLLDYTKFSESIFTDQLLGELISFISLKHKD